MLATNLTSEHAHLVCLGTVCELIQELLKVIFREEPCSILQVNVASKVSANGRLVLLALRINNIFEEFRRNLCICMGALMEAQYFLQLWQPLRGFAKGEKCAHCMHNVCFYDLIQVLGYEKMLYFSMYLLESS